MRTLVHLNLILVISLFSTAIFAQPLSEDFEGVPNLTIASNLPSGAWSTWSGNSSLEEAVVSNAQAANGSQSLLVTESTDALLLLGNKTSGIYTIQWNMYVTNSLNNEAAYYDFQKSEISGIEWGAEVYFYSNGVGQVVANTTDILFSFEFETWFKVTHFIDLDANLITMLINNVEVGSWPANTTPGGIGLGLKQLGAINFYSFHWSTAYFVDDLQYVDGILDHALVTGKMRHDDNVDCQLLGNENGLPNFGVQFQGQNGTYTRTTNPNGVYKFYAPPGDYDISVVAPNGYWDICPAASQIQLPNSSDTLELDFAAKAIVNCPAMSVDITALLLRRCFNNQLFVHYCNEGTIPASPASIVVHLDTFFNYISSSIPLSAQNGNTLTFDLGSVGIGECGDFTIGIYLDCSASLGQEHCYSAKIVPDTICNNTRSDQSYVEECRPNLGSFDPNDKRAFPAGLGLNNGILPNSEIKYQIRFQNTGTDTAFNIVVVDTISPLLDLTTLRMGSSSHPYLLSIDNRTVKFHFTDILLPDSIINEPGSHGFVNFFISQMTDLPEGTRLENQAAIYFDFNDPIWTNTAWNTVDDLTLVNPAPKQQFNLSLSPNPMVSWQNLLVASNIPIQNGQLSIYDANGILRLRQEYNGQSHYIALSDFAPGLYFVHLADNSGSFGVRKLVVMR